MAGLAARPVSVVDVPLGRIAGRVLAEAVPPARLAPASGGPLLAPGTFLNATHVPLLAELGLATVRAFERVRVGIIALLDEGKPSTGLVRRASQVATMLSAAVEQMGGKAFVSSCRTSDEGFFVRSVRVFAAECSLVLVVGSVDDELLAALKHSGVLGDSAGPTDISLRPFGDMQLARADSAHMLALPADPTRAFVTFTALVSPMIRALGGRFDVVPHASSAMLIDADTADSPEGGVLWVREQTQLASGRTDLVVCPAGQGAASLAGATGLAWRPADVDFGKPGAVVYLPFRNWIG